MNKLGERLKKRYYEKDKSTKSVEKRIDRRIYKCIKDNYDLFMTTWGGRGG